MDSTYLWLKTLHILSSTLLFGTGLGTAFFGWRAHQTGDVKIIYSTLRSVVIADWLFTLPSVIAQPLTGLLMVSSLGWPIDSLWIWGTLMLYAIVGLCWLPVVWLQIRMRNLAQQALSQYTPLPESYFRYFRLWFWLGWPAFTAVIIIFGLMVFKPI